MYGQVQNLSGGELQRVAIVLCLGQAANIYVIDEPSAYLDSEQRVVAAKVVHSSGLRLWVHHRVFQNRTYILFIILIVVFILAGHQKPFILHAKKTAFIVEHDFIMATYLSDRVIVYTGTPARNCVATSNARSSTYSLSQIYSIFFKSSTSEFEGLTNFMQTSVAVDRHESVPEGPGHYISS